MIQLLIKENKNKEIDNGKRYKSKNEIKDVLSTNGNDEEQRQREEKTNEMCKK